VTPTDSSERDSLVDAHIDSDHPAIHVHLSDGETRQWLTSLCATGSVRQEALADLHKLLLRVSFSELHRRGQQKITGPELDDLAHQAADDAVVAIISKLTEFRGESRFTTWAYRFAILEVSSKLARHFWQNPTEPIDLEEWTRLPDRFGIDPSDHAQRSELVTLLRRAVYEELTERQRLVFISLVVERIPLDALALKLKSSRNALYKTMFDARRKLRKALIVNGYLEDSENHSEDQHLQSRERHL
jgi:RNA polymerase sigma-70 factor (ECF subfamily)